jgi:hypothetical protein
MRGTNRAFVFGAVALAAACGLATSAQAHVRSLGDGNATISINTDTPGTRIGMDSWVVDGTNHLYNQWFWYRVGEGAGTSEHRINSLPELSVSTSNTNADPRDDVYRVSYGDPNGITIDVTFLLTGGSAGSHTSDIAESIRIVNHGSTAQSFHFFQYCDFDLNNDIVDDSVAINPNNTATQRDGPLAIAETVVTPMPNNREANTYANTISALDDGGSTDLNGNPGGGPGFDDGIRRDYTWAFQWDRVLGANGGTLLISKDKLITPTPGGVALLGLSGLLVARRRRH